MSEQISGTVTKNVYMKENGWSVYSVQYESNGLTMNTNIVGTMPAMKNGDFFTATGTWGENKFRSSPEFKVASVRLDLPYTEKAGRKFMEAVFSEEDHGITPERVSALFEKHGSEVLQKAERNPEIIVSASRDPNRFREKILEDWSAKISHRRAISTMQDAGLKNGEIQKVVDAYKHDTLEVIRKNPYRISNLMGFKSADLLGKHMGISEKDWRRIEAVLKDSLENHASKGDTYVEAKTLMEDAAKEGKLSQTDITQFIIGVLSGKDKSPLVFEKIDGKIYAALPELYRAEKLIVQKIAEKLTNGRKNLEREVNDLAEAILRERNKKFDETQKKAIILGASESIAMITGGPGTGKSTIQQVIAEVSAKLDGQLFLVAPTGRAAKRLSETTQMKAITIHKLLDARENKKGKGSIFGRNRNNPLPGPCVVVVDETSMVDTQMFAAIMDALPPDGRIILVGDRFQLPSVGPGAVLGDLNSCVSIPCVELEKVYRQGETSAIATGAKLIKEGVMPPLNSKIEGGVAFVECDAANISEVVKTMICETLPKRGYDPLNDVLVLSPQNTARAGTYELNTKISQVLNPNGEEVFRKTNWEIEKKPDMPLPRIGDRVMRLKNDDINEVYNGDVGTFLKKEKKVENGITREFMVVKFDDGKRIHYPVSDRMNFSVAFAGTIHKSQGSQKKVVIIPMTMDHRSMLNRNLLYTGWTRAEELLIIVGERRAVKTAIDTVTPQFRKTRLRKWLEEVSNSFEEKMGRRKAAVPSQKNTPLFSENPFDFGGYDDVIPASPEKKMAPAISFGFDPMSDNIFGFETPETSVPKPSVNKKPEPKASPFDMESIFHFDVTQDVDFPARKEEKETVSDDKEDAFNTNFGFQGRMTDKNKETTVPIEEDADDFGFNFKF